MPTHFATRWLLPIWLLAAVLLLCGCASNPASNSLTDSFVTYTQFRIQLIDSKTQQPIPEVDIVRVDPNLHSRSIWASIRESQLEECETKLATTDENGIAFVSSKDKYASLVCKLPFFAKLELNCLTHNAIYNHGLKQAPEPVKLEMHEVEPKLFQVIVPTSDNYQQFLPQPK